MLFDNNYELYVIVEKNVYTHVYLLNKIFYNLENCGTMLILNYLSIVAVPFRHFTSSLSGPLMQFTIPLLALCSLHSSTTHSLPLSCPSQWVSVTLCKLSGKLEIPTISLQCASLGVSCRIFITIMILYPLVSQFFLYLWYSSVLLLITNFIQVTFCKLQV